MCPDRQRVERGSRALRRIEQCPKCPETQYHMVSGSAMSLVVAMRVSSTSWHFPLDPHPVERGRSQPNSCSARVEGCSAMRRAGRQNSQSILEPWISLCGRNMLFVKTHSDKRDFASNARWYFLCTASTSDLSFPLLLDRRLQLCHVSKLSCRTIFGESAADR